ncbi:uncharacterized protein E0L32_010276 [Thyridium curvatum]|uniref:Uncharacterized protein n=1 Tax=Thyridium curvatum TaxID=1093900 RepID=A0A507AN75_9PEZI|nr:uncharacterized protein E0L32_010276 [Thyridium curvatum]TPX08076.1 hypothetical protein E0L32_010276 [Thyridium curvatum]
MDNVNLKRADAPSQAQAQAQSSSAEQEKEILTPKQSYDKHKDTLRDIITVDHFSNTIPDSIVDLWLAALDPGSRIALPAGVKGFYGGDLRSSIPIELAHDSYKYVVHETQDRAKVAKYARRMLLAISLLDLDSLARRDANLAGLALWHKALAQARLSDSDSAAQLAGTLKQYEALRPQASLPDAKLPRSERLKTRLLAVAQDLGNAETVTWLKNWEPREESS